MFKAAPTNIFVLMIDQLTVGSSQRMAPFTLHTENHHADLVSLSYVEHF